MEMNVAKLGGVGSGGVRRRGVGVRSGEVR